MAAIIGMAILLALAATLLATATAVADPDDHVLQVDVVGLKNDAGMVHFLVAASRAQFEDGVEPVRKGRVPIERNRASFRFEGLPDGDYAIKLFHDANGNDEFDRNVIGWPKENYGFSNNPDVHFRAPDFDEVKFRFDADHRSVEIKIH